MKKSLKLLFAFAAATPLILSAAAMSACASGRPPIADNKFSQIATEEQLAKARSCLASTDLSELFGEDFATSGYSARLYAEGEYDMEVYTESAENSAGITVWSDIKADHIVDLSQGTGGLSGRGTGSVNYSAGSKFHGTTAEDGGEIAMTALLVGNSYSDDDYFYVDGNVTSNLGALTVSYEKAKLAADDTFPQLFMNLVYPSSDIYVNLGMFSDILDVEGVTVYADSSSTLKLKATINVQSWATENASLLLYYANLAGINITFQQIVDNTNFGNYDYYMEFDGDTGEVLALGLDCNVDFNISGENEGVMYGVSYLIDAESWFSKSDRSAGELPSDLEDYVGL